jgi:hypothetical protein
MNWFYHIRFDLGGSVTEGPFADATIAQFACDRHRAAIEDDGDEVMHWEVYQELESEPGERVSPLTQEIPMSNLNTHRANLAEQAANAFLLAIALDGNDTAFPEQGHDRQFVLIDLIANALHLAHKLNQQGQIEYTAEQIARVALGHFTEEKND